MTEVTTLTDDEVDKDSSVDETLLDDHDEAAVDDTEDTVSDEDDADDSSIDSTDKNDEDEQEDEASLKRFAKGQGFDPDNLSDGEKKALRIAQKQVQKDRKALQDKKGSVVNEIDDIQRDDKSTDKDYIDFRLSQQEARLDWKEYWLDHPDEKQYEAFAVQILQREKSQYGQDAMFRLAKNIPRLMREAKYEAGGFDESRVKEKGRREERERLNKLQQGAADGASATTTEKGSKDEVTMEWIRTEYDPTNPEHRQKLDAAMAGGSIK